MNQTTLFSFSFIIIIFFFSSSFLITSSSSLNPKFQACNPTSCGNIPNITYPFYINGRQESFCGYPGFSLSCPNNASLILNLFGINYTIHEISYSNNSIRVSDTSLFSSTKVGSCVTIPRTHNLTLYGDRFHVVPNQKDVFLVYECELDSLSEYKIGCSPAANGTEYSVLGMREEREDLWENSCDGGFVKTKVEDYGDDNGGRIDLEVLKRGFLLNWTASDCSVCARTGGKCGYDDQIHSFRCYCPDRDHSRQCHSADGKSRALKLGLGLGLGLVIVVLVILVTGCFMRRHYKRKYCTSEDQYETRDTYSDDPENGNIYYGVPLFTYKELQEATNNFDNTKALGDGGFGIVYYGKLRDGREVAVKRLYEHNFRRVEQFRNEVTILTNLRHKNLVSLYGCSTSRHHTSNQNNHLLLVYEYISNGTLASHLDHFDHPNPPLTWHTRLRIAVETASAIAYLHASGIIHRDVKTANILLDGNLGVKVADFGLSRPVPGNVSHVSTAPQGTPGYVDPEYYQCYKLTSKSDVYSFGVVLMELVSSKPAVDMSRSDKEEVNLSSLAAKKMAEGEFWEVVDPLLGIEKDEEVKRMVVAVGELAVRCLNKDKEMRPTMEEVLEELKRIQNGGGDSAAAPVTAELEEKVVAVVPPGSPNTVTDKWKSESTTPNVSG